MSARWNLFHSLEPVDAAQRDGTASGPAEDETCGERLNHSTTDKIIHSTKSAFHTSPHWKRQRPLPLLIYNPAALWTFQFIPEVRRFGSSVRNNVCIIYCHDVDFTITSRQITFLLLWADCDFNNSFCCNERHIQAIDVNKKAELSQRWSRDAPYMGALEIFRSPWLRPRLLFPTSLMDFCSDRSCECAFKICLKFVALPLPEK